MSLPRSYTVTKRDIVKCVAWYDNEWGYSCRIADMCEFMAQAARSALVEMFSGPDLSSWLWI